MTGPELLRGEHDLRAVRARPAPGSSRSPPRTSCASSSARTSTSRSGNISFSSEQRRQMHARRARHRERARVRRHAAARHVFDGAVAVRARGRRPAAGSAIARPLYLSLTDYVQHKYAPGEPEATRFYRKIDEHFGRLADLGAIVALTADHGMNDKSNGRRHAERDLAAGHPRREVRQGRYQVICPITDALRRPSRRARRIRARLLPRQGDARPDAIRVISRSPGIESVLRQGNGVRACIDLPLDREGDVAVISTANVCIGGAENEHDLTGSKAIACARTAACRKRRCRSSSA